MEPLYKGHIGTLKTVLYIEVVLNSEVIVQWNLSIKDTCIYHSKRLTVIHSIDVTDSADLSYMRVNLLC